MLAIRSLLCPSEALRVGGEDKAECQHFRRITSPAATIYSRGNGEFARILPRQAAYADCPQNARKKQTSGYGDADLSAAAGALKHSRLHRRPRWKRVSRERQVLEEVKRTNQRILFREKRIARNVQRKLSLYV